MLPAQHNPWTSLEIAQMILLESLARRSRYIVAMAGLLLLPLFRIALLDSLDDVWKA
jgi:hypothetical protein